VTEGGGEIGFLDAAIFLEIACGVVGPDLLMEREEVVGFDTRGIVTAADLIIDSLGVVGPVEMAILDRAVGVLGEGTLDIVGRGPLSKCEFGPGIRTPAVFRERTPDIFRECTPGAFGKGPLTS